MLDQSFSQRVLAWHQIHGRTGLPWQVDRSPYRVWVSEIMLQQTQVQTVIDYFERFMQTFPDVRALANADEDDVLVLWSGLGYYARARNMHKAAVQVVAEFGGEFPNNIEDLMRLPGIGRSTAGAILSLSLGLPTPILDGNVKRVLTRHYAIGGYFESTPVRKQLWEIAETIMPEDHCQDYSQAMMDLGATLCTKSAPNCTFCPLRETCQAYLTDRVSDFPEKKPKKKKPVRAKYFVLLKDSKGRLLLERRKSQGIWGGLWAPPEFELDYQIVQNWLQSHALEVGSKLAVIDQFKHEFTHFRLEATLVSAELADDSSYPQPQDYRWIAEQHLRQVAMPAPFMERLQSVDWLKQTFQSHIT